MLNVDLWKPWKGKYNFGGKRLIQGLSVYVLKSNINPDINKYLLNSIPTTRPWNGFAQQKKRCVKVNRFKVTLRVPTLHDKAFIAKKDSYSLIYYLRIHSEIETERTYIKLSRPAMYYFAPQSINFPIDNRTCSIRSVDRLYKQR